MNRADLRAALADANVKAFLAVIRAGEGTSDDDGYRRCFGGSLFDSFADHPRRVIKAGGYTSTAAGAYQFLARTWDGLLDQYGFHDFSPACQDEAACALIAGRRALDDVRAGRVEAAIGKCNREWASLPGSPYGQPTRTMAQALAVYAAAGGSLAPVPLVQLDQAADAAADVRIAPTTAPDAAPAPTTAQASPDAPQPRKDFAMPPFLLAALPALIDAIPKLAQLFQGGVDTAEPKAVAVAQTVAQLVVDATGSKNVQEAVESIQADPSMLQAATQAIADNWFTLSEAGGGGIDGARQADAAFAAAGRKSVESPAFLISLVLLAMPFLLLIDVFFAHPANYSGELRTQIVTGVLMCISMVGAFWLGSSFGSMKKTEATAARDGA